jgi:hypothetical protein
MKKRFVLALALALTLPAVGAWTDDPSANTPPDPGAAVQAPAPDQAAPDAQPDQPKLADPAQPDPAQPNPVQPGPAQPAPIPADPAQPAPGVPDPLQPDRLPEQPIQPAQPEQPAQPATTPDPNAMPAGMTMNPLQEFVSHQNHEVGMLSDQMDAARAAGRKDLVMAMYHMIRDHTLVSDAAQNVLARRGQISRPFPVPMAEPMAQTPDEIIDQQLRHHQEEQGKVQQLLASANAPEERSIYQRSLAAVNKHLNWLQKFDQGQTVQIGFFGPTPSLSRIAGYRETSSVGQARSQRQGQSRRSRARRAGYRGSRSYR